jgi:hypothetical protein
MDPSLLTPYHKEPDIMNEPDAEPNADPSRYDEQRWAIQMAHRAMLDHLALSDTPPSLALWRMLLDAAASVDHFTWGLKMFVDAAASVDHFTWGLKMFGAWPSVDAAWQMAENILGDTFVFLTLNRSNSGIYTCIWWPSPSDISLHVISGMGSHAVPAKAIALGAVDAHQQHLLALLARDEAKAKNGVQE